MKKPAILALNFYQIFLSPILTTITGGRCRFEVSCSEFAKRSISEKGLVRGGVLALSRISKCQPFYG